MSTPPRIDPAHRHARDGEPARLSAEEVRAVLAAHGIGGLRSARAFIGGDPRSPKALVEADAGTLIIKRHTPEESEPGRVMLSRRAALVAAGAGVPVARAFEVGSDGRPFERDGAIYEVFARVAGRPYTGARAEAADAARVLADLHTALDGLAPAGAGEDEPGGPRADLGLLVRVLREQGLADDPAVAASLERLEGDRRMADAALRSGAGSGESTSGTRPAARGHIHGDYHPGNLIFRAGRVAAVLDFGSIRVGPRAAEIAAACLHLALIRRGTDPDGWPVAPDAGLLAAAWGAYTGRAWEEPGARPAWADPALVPWRMIESVIEETVMRVAAGAPVDSVRYTARVTAWLCDHADGVGAVLAEATGD